VVMTNPERLCEALDVIMAILDEIQETENVTFRLREGEEESSGFVTLSVEKMGVGLERYLKILECLQGVPSQGSAQMGELTAAVRDTGGTLRLSFDEQRGICFHVDLPAVERKTSAQ
ncbi:MAG: hypothetical protein PHY31_09345, partial [Smithellaceae bacterium]|nr:hypothetical protein [Smithellaceae bacterium]